MWSRDIYEAGAMDDKRYRCAIFTRLGLAEITPLLRSLQKRYGFEHGQTPQADYNRAALEDALVPWVHCMLSCLGIAMGVRV